MATIQDNQDKDKDPNDQSAGVNVSGSQDTNSAGPSTGAPKAAGSGTSNYAAPTKSGSFTNIQNYIKANQGYNQDNGGLAGQINSNLTNQGNDIKSQANQGYQDFSNKANQNRVQEDGSYTNTVNGAFADPNAFAQNADNVSNFAKYRDANYSGPTGINNAATYQNQAQNYQQLTNQTGNENGRFNLLRNMFDQPSYTSGQQGLDNLLLQSNPNQLAQLQKAQAMGGSVNNSVNQNVNNAATEATNYNNEAAKTQQDTRNALNTNITGFDTNAQSAVDAQNAARAASIAGIKNDIHYGNYSAQDLANLGLQKGQAIGNLDLSKYIDPSTQAVTKQNAISADQYNRINALNKLSGGTSTGDQSAILSNFAGPSQVGTLGNAYGFNNAGFQNDLTANNNAHDKAFQGLQDKINSIKNTQASSYAGGANTTVTPKSGISGNTQTGQNLNQYNNKQIQDLIAQQQLLDQQYGKGNTIK